MLLYAFKLKLERCASLLIIKVRAFTISNELLTATKSPLNLSLTTSVTDPTGVIIGITP